MTALVRRPPPGAGAGAGDLDAGAGGGGAAPPSWAARVAAADIIVVHLERLDARALHGPPLADVVAAARPGAVPVVVLAGRAEASRREWSAAGLSGVHEVGDDDGDRVARVAATWAPRWREASHRGRPLPHGGARA
ncbi:glycerate kinase [Puerhibacterium puerhi]|uniref:glycerate kinase n=1 Tax=Puerhibacterium puerhi TaxID=2692623 RepID=UPI00135CA2F7|nr:glycerate kinase [Puerhibacterium puerhi]